MHIFKKSLIIASAAAALTGIAVVGVRAQQRNDFLTQVDGNRDGSVTRDELKAAMRGWLGGKTSITQDELTKALDEAIPEGTFMGMISPPQTRTPKPEDVEKMMAALPTAAPAKPGKPRRILVLNKCAGFVHSCIPLAAKTVEEMGAKTGAWTADVSYDATVITAENLKRYDAILLNNTTGHFLDDPDPVVTAARRKALLDFVRSGKGLAGVHAASDAYHKSTAGPGMVSMLANGIFAAGDENQDKAIEGKELDAIADKWFDMVDTAKSGSVTAQNFRAGFPRMVFGLRGPRRSGPPAPQSVRTGPDPQIGTWSDFNRMIGGYFKFHWNDPQHIVYKIDDPDSPLTAMFKGGFEIDDETYTFGIKSWSRENLRVLTSIDYAKMSEADKLKEDYPREDHDYGLSWIRREGKGRVFYSAHGHSERVYAIRPMLEHMLAGIQYALGDLKANDAPSVKPKK